MGTQVISGRFDGFGLSILGDARQGAMESFLNESYAAVWFPAVFALAWVGATVLLSVMSGWHQLASRFRATSPIEGERCRFASLSLGTGAFPMSYRNCIFVTVGRSGFVMSVLFLYRMFHPPIYVPWSAVETVHPEQRWFLMCTAVYIRGFEKRLLFRGRAGRKILEMFQVQSGAESAESER